MRSIVLSILVIFVMQAYAKELLMKELLMIGNTLKVVDEVIDKMQGHWLPHHGDLHNTVLGKPGHIAMSLQSRGFLQPLPLFRLPRPLFQNLPLQVQPWRLQSVWGRVSGLGKSSGSSGAKPQRKS